MNTYILSLMLFIDMCVSGYELHYIPRNDNASNINYNEMLCGWDSNGVSSCSPLLQAPASMKSDSRILLIVGLLYMLIPHPPR